MQEEVEQKTVNLAVTTTKLTGRVAVKAIAWYLRHRKEKKLEKANEIPHGTFLCRCEIFHKWIDCHYTGF